MVPVNVLREFDEHCGRLESIHRKRKIDVSFKNIVFDSEERGSLSVADTLGKRMPQDEFRGDVNLRTLRALLTLVDERGWERSA